VLNTVWQACQAEAMRLTGSWQGMVARCYPETSVSLFSMDEVDAAFKRHKPSATGHA
jgi:hypothetical protein